MLPLIGIALEIARLAAPRLISALTDSDKAGEVAERVINVAQEVTGTAAPEAALTALRADPSLVLQANVRMQEIEADLDKAYLADRAGARSRDVELAKLGVSNTRANYMVLLDVVGLISCLAVLVFFSDKIPGEVVGIVATVAGVFGACLRDAHQFEFGSSRSSKEKDALIARSFTG
jgi:hypothetical protein